jgi:hypothetical protein
VTSNVLQCDSCAFKVVEHQTTPESDIAVENKYKALRALSGAPKKMRIVSISIGVSGNEKTETCFINSPLWPTKVKETYCPDRIEDCLSLEIALSLRISAEANRIATEDLAIARSSAVIAREQARWAKWAAIIATVTAIIATKDQILALIFHP